MHWDVAEHDAWRALPAGTYWIEIVGEPRTGAYSVDAARITPTEPRLTDWPSWHVHPGEFVTYGIENANRDSRFFLGGLPANVRVGYDTSLYQWVQIEIPAGLPDGDHALSVANGDQKATRCCFKVVPHLHPAIRMAITEVVPPENGIGYRWDEPAPLTVVVRNEGTAPSGGRIHLFIAFPLGGGWSEPSFPFPHLAPGESAEIPVTVDLGGYVGDMRVSAGSGAPHLLSIAPATGPLRENEAMLPALVGGMGTGFFVPGFVG